MDIGTDDCDDASPVTRSLCGVYLSLPQPGRSTTEQLGGHVAPRYLPRPSTPQCDVALHSSQVAEISIHRLVRLLLQLIPKTKMERRRVP